MTYLNQSNNEFLNYKRNEIFVDKFLLIQECNKLLGSKKSYMCIVKPRRLGKSMTLAMLNTYYSKGCKSKNFLKV